MAKSLQILGRILGSHLIELLFAVFLHQVELGVHLSKLLILNLKPTILQQPMLIHQRGRKMVSIRLWDPQGGQGLRLDEERLGHIVVVLEQKSLEVLELMDGDLGMLVLSVMDQVADLVIKLIGIVR